MRRTRIHGKHMSIVLHIASKPAWEQASRGASYSPTTLGRAILLACWYHRTYPSQARAEGQA